MSEDLSTWEPKQLTGDTTVELRVHDDGCVMWHREGCALGAKEGALAIGVVKGIPYSAFRLSFEREHPHAERGVLFCGGCLIFEPAE